jgi:Flp pilus assembly protein TadD
VRNSGFVSSFDRMWLGLIFVVAAVAQAQGLREAARLDQEGKCEEAEVYYSKALAEGAASAALLNNAGNHYLLCGEPEKARTYFAQLQKAQPDHPNASLQLARLAVAGKQGEAALAHLARVKSGQPAVRLVRAEALHLAGKPDAALTELDAVESQAGGDPRVLFAIGAAFARLSRFDRAEQAFQQVLVQRPDDFNVLFHLGRAAARAQHYERAQSVLTAAVRLRPGDADALLELALAHAASKDYSRAVYLLAQARQKAPGRSDIVLALARSAEDAEFYGDSAVAYDEYLRLKPDDEIAGRDRARVLGYTGARLEEGLREMKAYCEKHPEDPAGHYNLAQFTWQTDPEKSLQQLATALNADPKFAPAHVSRAWLLHRMGRSAEAARHLEAALAISPENLRALDQLGLVYLALDRPLDAEKALRRALAIHPKDPDVLAHMGRTLMALDREEEAQRFLATYQKVRPRRHRGPRREPGMIGLATLSEEERRNREIDRLRHLANSRPDDPVLQRHLADLLLAGGTLEEAKVAFARLLELNADPQVLEEAGRSLARAQEYQLARPFLERAAVDRPGARLDLALTLLHLEGPDVALRTIDEVPMDARTQDFLLLKARILEAAGHSGEAGTLLTAGLRESDIRPDLVTDAAVQLLRYERETDALEFVSRAVASNGNDGDILLTHAIVLAASGRSKEAGKQVRTVQSLWPEWDLPYVVHGLLLESTGRKDEAMQKLKIAVGLGSEEAAAICALARLSGGPLPEARCACLIGIREFALRTCDFQQPAGK